MVARLSVRLVFRLKWAVFPSSLSFGTMLTHLIIIIFVDVRCFGVSRFATFCFDAMGMFERVCVCECETWAIKIFAIYLFYSFDSHFFALSMRFSQLLCPLRSLAVSYFIFVHLLKEICCSQFSAFHCIYENTQASAHNSHIRKKVASNLSRSSSWSQFYTHPKYSFT